MKLPSILTPGKIKSLASGFTFIEILVGMALVAILGSMGLIAGVDSYQRYLFRSDLETVASLLQKARSSAMNNIGETSHGVYVGDASSLILFRGASYTILPAYDLKVEKSKTVMYTSRREKWSAFNKSDNETEQEHGCLVVGRSGRACRANDWISCSRSWFEGLRS